MSNHGGEKRRAALLKDGPSESHGIGLHIQFTCRRVLSYYIILDRVFTGDCNVIYSYGAHLAIYFWYAAPSKLFLTINIACNQPTFTLIKPFLTVELNFKKSMIKNL